MVKNSMDGAEIPPYLHQIAGLDQFSDVCLTLIPQRVVLGGHYKRRRHPSQVAGKERRAAENRGEFVPLMVVKMMLVGRLNLAEGALFSTRNS
jgi:hypothetical protein